MILLSYTYPDGARTIVGDVAIDATVNETHTTSAQVTDHQVETGSNITDHIRPMPRQLTLEAIISNTPIATPPTPNRGVIGIEQGTMVVVPPSINGVLSLRPLPYVTRISALQFNGPVDRVRDVFGILVDAALHGALFTITTTYKQYQNFAITTFSVPRDASRGNVLHGSIDFKEIRFASAVVVKGLTPRPKKITKPDHNGPKAPEVLPTPDPASLSRKLVDHYIPGFLPKETLPAE